MGMVVGVAVIMRMAVGGGGNHFRTLYYNITEVHHPQISLAFSS